LFERLSAVDLNRQRVYVDSPANHLPMGVAHGVQIGLPMRQEMLQRFA
jgi:hypothetical protein